MKDLITTIASILVLMMFLLQFTANQRTFTEIAGVENAIKIFRIAAESKGKIGDEDVSSMHAAAAKAARCDLSEVETILNPDKNEGSEHTSYQVRVPIRGIIGAAHMLGGLTKEENTLWYTSSGIIALQEKDQVILEETEGEMPAEGANRPGSEEKAEQEESTGKEQVLERSEK